MATQQNATSTLDNEFAFTLGKALLATTFETTIAKTKTFQLSLADFPVEAALAFMQYGIGRKFNDAVGGSDKTATVKVELAEAMIADWKLGKIGRQAAVSVPNTLKVQRQIIRELFNASASDKAKEDFKALDANKQAERLDVIYAKQSEAKQSAIYTEVLKRLDAVEAKAEQARKLAEGIEL